MLSFPLKFVKLKDIDGHFFKPIEYFAETLCEHKGIVKATEQDLQTFKEMGWDIEVTDLNRDVIFL